MGSALTTVLSALSALAAGACLAATGLLQQRAASVRPPGEEMRLKLIVKLVQNKTWLAGIGMAFVSYGFQAVALALGPLALVQPLIVSEPIFAIPISVRWRGDRLRRREWFAVLSVVTALPLVGISIGVALFNEQVRTGALALTGTAVGLALLLIGITLLDTSSLIRRQQQTEHEEKEETAEQEQRAAE